MEAATKSEVGFLLENIEYFLEMEEDSETILRLKEWIKLYKKEEGF